MNALNAIRSQAGAVIDETATAWLPLRGARLFITGGSGFFGQWLLTTIDLLNDRFKFGISASILTRRPDQLWEQLQFLSQPGSFSLVAGDVRSFVFPAGSFDILIHGATTSAHETFSGTGSLGKFDLLVDGTRRVMQFAEGKGLKKALFLSSGVVYGTPSSIGPISEDEPAAPSTTHSQGGLAQGKRAAEFIFSERCRILGVDAVIARCFSFIGAGLPHNVHYAVGNFVASALRNEDIIIQSDGSAIRSYMDMRDLVIWLGLLLGNKNNHLIYNVGSDEGITIRDLAACVVDVLGSKSQIVIKGDESFSIGNPVRSFYVPTIERFYCEFSYVNLHTLVSSILDYGFSLEVMGKGKLGFTYEVQRGVATD